MKKTKQCRRIPNTIQPNTTYEHRNNTRQTNKHAWQTNARNKTPPKKIQKHTGNGQGKLFQNTNIPEKLRVQLRNALIRTTLTYALMTQELTTSQNKK